jgi:hypothetical protein
MHLCASAQVEHFRFFAASRHRLAGKRVRLERQIGEATIKHRLDG